MSCFLILHGSLKITLFSVLCIYNYNLLNLVLVLVVVRHLVTFTVHMKFSPELALATLHGQADIDMMLPCNVAGAPSTEL